VTGFADGWDWDLAGEFHPHWESRGYLAGCFIEVDDLVSVVNGVLRAGASTSLPIVTVAPRPPAPAP
jgi:hypothetical protein